MATALAVLSGCAAAAPSVPSAPATFASVQPAKVAKLLVFVVENHSLDQMRADMPYTAALGKQFSGIPSAYSFAVQPPDRPTVGVRAGAVAGPDGEAVRGGDAREL